MNSKLFHLKFHRLSSVRIAVDVDNSESRKVENIVYQKYFHRFYDYLNFFYCSRIEIGVGHFQSWD